MAYKDDENNYINKVKNEIREVIDEIDELIDSNTEPIYEKFDLDFVESLLNQLNDIKSLWN